MQQEADHLLPPVADGSIALPVPVLNGADEALCRRLVRTMGQRLGAEMSREQTEAVLSLKSGGCLDLPQGLCAVRKPHRLILRKRSPLPPPLVLREGEQEWGPWRIAVCRREGPAAEGPDRIVLRDTGGELTVSAWNGTGRLAVENGSRTIKRLFADKGISIERRGERPAVLLDGEPAAVLGVAVDWGLRPEDGEPCWIVSFQRMDGRRTP